MNTLLMLFIFVPILSVILLALNLLLAPKKADEAKVSAYECGFNAIPGQTRSTFHIHFYIVAMLFLVFDLEILLLFPIAVTLYQVSTYGFSIALIFFIVLTIGFVLEIGSGAISMSTPGNNKTSFTPELRRRSPTPINKVLVNKLSKVGKPLSYSIFIFAILNDFQFTTEILNNDIIINSFLYSSFSVGPLVLNNSSKNYKYLKLNEQINNRKKT